MKLPAELEKIIEKEFEHVSLRQVTKASGVLRDNYRRAGHSETVDAEDLKAYIAYRLPGTFAGINFVYQELRERYPEYAPATFLDCGAGPGTGMWAAHEVWPSVNTITLLEQNTAMITIGKKLAGNASSFAIQNAVWRQSDIRTAWSSSVSDIVSMSYVLGEIDDALHEKVLENAWQHTGHSLCIIEPAKSPRGAVIIERAALYLQKLGAVIVAPWPDPAVYNLGVDRWLHFGQRVERSRLQRLVKGGFRPYEDEKFSYVIASRYPGTQYAARIITPPIIKSGHVSVEMYMSGRLQQFVFTKKRHPEIYGIVKKLKWGEALSEGHPVVVEAKRLEK